MPGLHYTTDIDAHAGIWRGLANSSLLAGAALVLALILGNNALSMLSTREVHHDADWVSHSHEMIERLERIQALVAEAEAGQRGYIITGDPAYLAPHVAATAALDDELDNLQNAVRDNSDQLARLSDLRAKVDRRLTILNRNLKLRETDGLEAARQRMLTGEGKAAHEAIRTAVASLISHEGQLLADRRAASLRSYRLAFVTSLVSGLTALLATALFMLAMQRTVRAYVRAANVVGVQAERIQTTLSSIGDGVITTDKRGHVTHLNPIAESLTGWTNAAAQEQPLDVVFQIINEETRRTVDNPALRALEDGIIVGLANHTVLIARDGKERPIDDSAAPIRARDGQIIGSVLVFRDITERKRVEREAQERERFITRILSASPGIVYVYDLPTRQVVFVNERLREVLRLSPEELRSSGERFLLDHLHPEDLPQLQAHLDRVTALPDRAVASTEYRIRQPDGQWSWLVSRDTVFLRDEQGRPRQILGVASDLSDRKAAELKLRESEENFRNLADNMLQLAWMADPQGSIFWYNSRWYEDTGTTLEEMRGGGWKTIVHPDHADRVVRKLQRAWDSGQLWEDTFPLRLKDGTYRWFLSRAVPIRNERGEIVRWFGTNTDVTDQQQMSDELRLLAASLSEEGRRKNEFLATLAHELRNPLAPIRNMLEILKREESNPDLLAQARTTMDRQVNQMVRLVDDLLDISRITHNRLELRRGKVELATIIQQSIEMTRSLMDSVGQQLSVALPSQPLWLDADSARLSQVFGNLLNNASKYSEPGSQIELFAEQVGNEVQVHVKDQGIGLAPEDRHRVFEMFSQVSSAQDRSQGGLGIGLTLVKRLVEMHGGTVSVFSEGIGRGCDFLVCLPLLKTAPPPAPASDPEQSLMVPTKKRRILVVDDNKDAAFTLAMLLKVAGHETQLAHDGQEAVLAAERLKPDVILLDIGLPKLNGYEAARKIRAEPWGQEIVLVASTGWGQEEDRRKSLEAGFDHHLVKPVRFDDLEKLLGALP